MRAAWPEHDQYFIMFIPICCPVTYGFPVCLQTGFQMKAHKIWNIFIEWNTRLDMSGCTVCLPVCISFVRDTHTHQTNIDLNIPSMVKLLLWTLHDRRLCCLRVCVTGYERRWIHEYPYNFYAIWTISLLCYTKLHYTINGRADIKATYSRDAVFECAAAQCCYRAVPISLKCAFSLVMLLWLLKITINNVVIP